MAVSYNQSGYLGCSMSERAAMAYERGEKPLSKWRKGELLRMAKEAYGESFEKEMAKRPLGQLKKELLQNEGWHHTGPYLRETDFYGFAEGMERYELDEILSHPVEKAEKRKPQTEEEWAVGIYEYAYNRGTRNWPNWMTVRTCVLAHRKAGQSSWILEDGKRVWNFVPDHSFGNKKPRKNSKWLKEVGESREEKFRKY